MDSGRLARCLVLLLFIVGVVQPVLLAEVQSIPDLWNGLIGRYEKSATEHFLVRESNGNLEILGQFLQNQDCSQMVFRGSRYTVIPLEQIEGSSVDFRGNCGSKEFFVTFHLDVRGFGVLCWVNGELFERSFYGPELGHGFRIDALEDSSILREKALGASPPEQPVSLRKPDLVDLKTLDAPLIIDIKYATEDNFMGIVLYPGNVAFLQRPAARALESAAKKLESLGLGLVVYDAYRPWYVTKMFWDATPPELRGFVANPAFGSRHNRGCAVDVGLYYLQTGEYVRKPSGFDEFSERAYTDFPGGTQYERNARDLLIRAMAEAGFSVYRDEWWHFDYHSWDQYPIMNIDFDQLP